ncbi:hypothetical protein VOA_001383 [Vibrio sp. RC586]|uniref:hypothetical protein n=1 Tax=Vibrio sp. RC586 TaxID=675815 RepID=UPI0001BB83DD|nr:hypothetical protein [Vibrio sp. RC586]EEZ00026.1 hypothetical protein VOA_001383 [Vibrio sp. RC586]
MKSISVISSLLISILASSGATALSLPPEGYFPPEPPNPPVSATKSLSISSSLGDKVEIYANGNMQAKLLVKYELSSGFYNPKITLKQKDLGSDLPSTWNVSFIDNGFSHLLDTRSITARSLEKSQTAEVVYVTSKEVDYMDICVELTAEHIRHGVKTSSTCFENTNQDRVLVTAKQPVIYSNNDFEIKYTNEVKNKKLTIKNYSISPKENVKNLVFKVGDGHLRVPDSKNNVYSIPKNSKLLQVNSNGSYLSFAEFLPGGINTYRTESSISDPWVLEVLNDSKALLNLAYGTGNDLVTTTNTDKCIRWGFRPLPTGSGYVKYCIEFQKIKTNAWPMPLATTHRKTHNIYMMDNYGTSHKLSFRFIDGALYYGNEHIK